MQPNPAAVLRLHEADDVVVAMRQLLPGERVTIESCGELAVREPIPPGHKMAIRAIAAGAPLRRYGQVIGFACQAIGAGQHVHGHNLGVGDFAAMARDFAGVMPHAAKAAIAAVSTFNGFRRADGRVGTRNYIAVIASVNCSATVTRAIAAAFSVDRLKPFPNVDGVVAIVHPSGCGMNMAGEGLALLQRTLIGYARHPNFAGVVLVGLGCEHNQVRPLVEGAGADASQMLRYVVMQEEGGTRAAIERGVAMVEAMLPVANAFVRESVPVNELIVGLNCGGSDGYSGITANPALGGAADLLIAQGGTTVLSETPEIYGAEHLLIQRAASPEVANALLERIAWWKDYTARSGGELDNNPSVGNKAGGLTTILEKSLGAVAKGGTSRLNAVYRYAETVTAKGLVFMDTPGYDPVSATGQAAGGAQIICFTTGRGSAFGCAGVPTIKLATNSAIFERMRDDMDVNCGDLVSGMPMAAISQRIVEAIVRHASGERTRSEELGYGHDEFVPWQVGAVM